MKTDTFPKDWQIILFAMIMFFLCLQACTTSKNVQREQTKQETESKSSEAVKTNTDAQTQTTSQIFTETNIVEECDTIIEVSIPIVKKLDSTFVIHDTIIKAKVPVSFTRTTNRKENRQVQEEKKEQTQVSAEKKEQVSQKSETAMVNKQIERAGFPWWAVAMGVILVIVVAVAVSYLKRKYLL
jgi:hypothetical protein